MKLISQLSFSLVPLLFAGSLKAEMIEAKLFDCTSAETSLKGQVTTVKGVIAAIQITSPGAKTFVLYSEDQQSVQFVDPNESDLDKKELNAYSVVMKMKPSDFANARQSQPFAFETVRRGSSTPKPFSCRF